MQTSLRRGWQMAKRGLTIAVEGCGHGELEKIYGTMHQIEQRQNIKIDLLIICGDFQAIRNLDDLECMACPPKYREMNTYWKYYAGLAKAPYPTLFIGGNHEAANHLWELYYGGWVAPQMYYLGHAGVVNFGGVRIGGMSGIYDRRDYRKGHFEAPPYTPSTLRSAYHVRELEVQRLLRLQPSLADRPLDVFLSHDWPQGIEAYGDKQGLLAKKPYFKQDMDSGELGSPPAMELLRALQPSYWFAAHLHCKFAAVYPHGGQSSTRFLALDKCLPRRDFLQVVHFPEADGPLHFSYDEAWLAVLRSTHGALELGYQHRPLPPPGPQGAIPDADIRFVREALAGREEGARVPDNFVPTAPAFDPNDPRASRRPLTGKMPQRLARNPQTEALLSMLGLPYNLEPGQAPGPSQGHLVSPGPGPSGRTPFGTPLSHHRSAGVGSTPRSVNPEEIDLDGDGDPMFLHVNIYTTVGVQGQGPGADLDQQDIPPPPPLPTTLTLGGSKEKRKRTDDKEIDLGDL